MECQTLSEWTVTKIYVCQFAKNAALLNPDYKISFYEISYSFTNPLINDFK